MSFNRTPSNCPCKDCEHREVGCHGKCEGYKKWASELEEIRKKRYDLNESLYTISRNHLRHNWREIKKRKKHGSRE